MKNILLMCCLIIINCMLLSCFTDEASSTEPEDVVLRFDTLELDYNGVKYKCGGFEPLTCELPYSADKTSLKIYFDIHESLTLYIDGMPVESGEQSFDFTNDVTFVMKDQKGNERTGSISVVYGQNTEAILYSMSVLVDSTEYSCTISEENKTVSVNIADKTKSQLNDVQFSYIVSDNAGLYFGDSQLLEGYTWALGNRIDSGYTTLTVKAENTKYTTDYELLVSCIDCGK